MATADWAPDFGPAAPHPTAGATVVGARMPLIAYNINLATDRLDVAEEDRRRRPAQQRRVPFVKAMGVTLEDRGIVQVSMNLTNYEKTPIFRVFETVKREAGAARRGRARKRDRGAGAVGGADVRRRVLSAALRLLGRSGAREQARKSC